MKRDLNAKAFDAWTKALALGEALERVLLDRVDTLQAGGRASLVATRKQLASEVNDQLLPSVDRLKVQLKEHLPSLGTRKR